MNNQYKIIVSNKKLFKEVILDGQGTMKLGTTKDCGLRLSKDMFFSEFELTFENNGDEWAVNCDDSIYIYADGVMKLASKTLTHGDNFAIKYQESNQEIFKVSFMLDFESENKDYNRVIDISDITQVTFGSGAKNDISINDDLLGTDRIALKKNGGRYYINDNDSKYGVYVNGAKINGSKEITDYDFFSVVSVSFYFKYGKLYTTESKKVQVNGLPESMLFAHSSHYPYPKFSRNTRMQHVVPKKNIEIQQPQPKPQKNRQNIVVALIPSLAMLGLVVLLRGSMGGAGTFIIYSACTMGVGIIMTVVNFVIDNRDFKKSLIKRETQYLDYIKRKEEEITALRDYELQVQKEINVSLDKSIEEVRSYGKRLFEKDFQDVDFLGVFLGCGAVEAQCKTTYSKKESIDTDDPISELPEQMEYKYRYINNAPIVSDFKQSNGIGIVGDKEKLLGLLRNISLDIVIRHFYKDVKLFYMFDSSENEKFKWLRWLKHVYNDTLGIRNLLCDEESRDMLLEYLYSEVSQREAAGKADKKSYANNIVFMFLSSEIIKHPISRYIQSASEYGFTFVFLEEYEEFLPKGCKEVIYLDSNDETGTLCLSEDSEKQFHFSYGGVSDGQAEEVALKLSPIYVDEVNLESELIKSITLFELLNIMRVDDLDLDERWRGSKVYKSLAAPLGVKRKNEIVCLDISDKAKAHGPHGLVAGTTGSGKSEILQAYVLSMASLFHPYDVGFVIIDFKGGGMANQFKELPHLMGAITNIDGREINRSLLSIKAELIRRQELFSENGVNHIDDYIKLYKKGEVSQPLPHLIMIVDEFAELKAEFPDFMKEIISAARIGRTLGVHLILATQKPSGVVDNQIWSNSKFKLCLKVQTKEDSNEVIKTPLAAEIVEPGRAYLQVGNNEIFELFQSAYSGAKVDEQNAVKTKEYAIYSLNLWGKRNLVYTNKKQASDHGSKNQLQVMVEYINEYCTKNRIAKLSGICLPPLAERVFVSSLAALKKDLTEGIKAAVGITDDPEQQKQESLVINLSENNTYIIGSAQTGKTTLLQTMIYQLMKTYTPEEVNIYIADCGNMALNVFKDSHHVGGVVLATEEERMLNLFKMLGNTIDSRKRIFAKKGLGTYRSYVEAGFTDLPQILLIIDNITVFKDYYSKLDDDFLFLSREGQSVGVSIIATGSQTNSLSYKALANYGNRIAFNCNDKSEYSNLFDRCRTEPKEAPGRGLCVVDKRILEFQAALAFEGEKEITRVENMKLFIQSNGAIYKNTKAAPIPEVPEIIRRSDLVKTHKDLFTKPYMIPLGIEYSSVGYVYIDLATAFMLGIAGKERGKTNLVRNIMYTLKENIFSSLTEAYVIEQNKKDAEEIGKIGFVRECSSSAKSIGSFIDILCERLEDRERFVSENEDGMEEALQKQPLLLFVIDHSDAVSELAGDKALHAKLTDMIRKYRKYKLMVIFSDFENAPVTFNTPEIVKLIKENKRLIVFDEIENVKICEVSAKQAREFGKPITPGDAYVFTGGEVSKVKTILCDMD